MSTPPDQRTLARRLRRQGLPRRAAERMAFEWLAHREDLVADACAAGYDVNAARNVADERLGNPRTLLDEVAVLPVSLAAVADRDRAVLVLRWSGAGLGGLVTTACLFATLTGVIGI